MNTNLPLGTINSFTMIAQDNLPEEIERQKKMYNERIQAVLENWDHRLTFGIGDVHKRQLKEDLVLSLLFSENN